MNFSSRASTATFAKPSSCAEGVSRQHTADGLVFKRTGTKNIRKRADNEYETTAKKKKKNVGGALCVLQEVLLGTVCRRLHAESKAESRKVPKAKHFLSW